ncbi:UNVERIFIED_CONTAM: ABC transporter B family member 26, chloroplastic [Sesamum indicum]
MATLPTTLHYYISFNDQETGSFPISTSTSKLKFRNSSAILTLARPSYPICNYSSVYALTPISDGFKQNREGCCDTRNEALHFKGWMETVRDILPGGSWWNLNDVDQNTNGSPVAAKPMAVMEALSQIWALVADEKWILYTAFGALTVAAVAQETLSSTRTVRAYGTEREEFQRYKQWLDRLASVGVRESVAYGFWTLSFSTFYRSTQVLAVLFGGMSILSGCVSAEQLTKYVLYCEWLIYAAWRLQDSMSSLLQSLGACTKVFELMHLPPSSEFL